MKDDTILLVLKNDRVPADALARLHAAAPEAFSIICADKAAVLPQLQRATIVAGDFPVSLIPECPRLRWFQSWSAGTDWLMKYPELAKLPFLLTNASGIHGEAMSEHLFGLLLAWCRKLPQAVQAQRRAEWLSVGHKDLSTLSGRTMLILGYGVIGERIARLALAFGMTVIGVKRSVSADSPVADPRLRVIALEALGSYLPDADVVANILPYTVETRLFIDAAFFRKMKPSALFANIGRGGTVDEAALVVALQTRSIAGAVLDVASEEPLPPSSPLWNLDNLILTSHYGGCYPYYDELAFALFLDNLVRDRHDEQLRNLVDKTRGY